MPSSPKCKSQVPKQKIPYNRKGFFWYSRRDLNPYAFRHRNLNPTCLPISPLEQKVRRIYGKHCSLASRSSPHPQKKYAHGALPPRSKHRQNFRNSDSNMIFSHPLPDSPLNPRPDRRKQYHWKECGRAGNLLNYRTYKSSARLKWFPPREERKRDSFAQNAPLKTYSGVPYQPLPWFLLICFSYSYSKLRESGFGLISAWNMIFPLFPEATISKIPYKPLENTTK